MNALERSGRQALAEIGDVIARTDEAGIDRLVEALARARRIVLHGLGREGLMMRALTMRLFHMGLDVHVLGDMTMPPVGPGDLLVVSAGPGAIPSVAAFLGIAAAAGAATLCITAQPDGTTARLAHQIVVLPAQTMANDRPGGHAAVSAILPMGSVFEGVMFLVFELVVLRLRERLGVSPEAMRARHTNLE